MTAPRLELRIAGVDVSCWTLAGARVTIGRASVWEQSAAGTLTVRLVGNSVAGRDGLLALDSLAELWAETRGSGPDWRIFAGRITDIAAERDPDRPRWIATVVAAGTLAELARFKIGDEPWPIEPDTDRLARILTLAGYDSAGIPDLPGPDLYARDIDRQEPAALLREVATSAGGLLWEDHARTDTATGGALIAYQPLVWRDVSSLALWDQIADTWDGIDPGTVWDTETLDTPTAPWLIDPCALSGDEWTWDTRIGDLITHARVEYGGNDPATVVTAGSLAPPVYEQSLKSELADEADAQALADRVILGRGQARWSTETAALDVTRLPPGDLEALPGRLVAGRAVRITPMLPGSPSPEFLGFIEGWEHEISIETGVLAWWIQLFITDATMTAPATTWDQAAAVTWDTITPADVWDQLLLTGV